MKVWLRKAYAGVAWLLAAGVVVQFLLVGLALFAGYGFKPHIEFGYYFISAVSLALPLLAVFGGLPRRLIGWSALLLVLILVQVSLPGFRSTAPVIAALHPVNALLVLWFGVRLARQARSYIAETPQAVPAAALPAKDPA